MGLCKSRRFFGKKTSLIFMLTMTGTFFVAEITVGYITNSTALVADSFHMLSDVLSLIIGFLAVFYSGKNSRHNTYGWARAEVLGALANAVFLFALCFSIVVSAVQRLVQLEKVENPLLIIYVGFAGLFINLIGLVLFHGHSHGHHHDHHHHEQHPDPGHTEILVEHKDLDLEKSEESSTSGGELNMKGVFLHVLGDTLGSVVVLISALIIHFAEGDWKYYIDPVMTLVIATIIIFTTWPLLKQSSLILLQNPPSHINREDLLFELLKISGIQNIHDFHVWQLSDKVIIASAHITMHKEDSFNETAMKVNQLFHDKGVHSLTLQPEFYECSEGQSLCGSDTCHYLAQNKAETILDGQRKESTDTTVSLERQYINSQPPTCLLSCVSKNCKKYQCCSNLNDRKANKSSGNIAKETGLSNPCFSNVNLSMSASNCSQNATGPNNISANKSMTLPRCNKQGQNDSMA